MTYGIKNSGRTALMNLLKQALKVQVRDAAMFNEGKTKKLLLLLTAAFKKIRYYKVAMSITKR